MYGNAAKIQEVLPHRSLRVDGGGAEEWGRYKKGSKGGGEQAGGLHEKLEFSNFRETDGFLSRSGNLYVTPHNIRAEGGRGL